MKKLMIGSLAAVVIAASALGVSLGKRGAARFVVLGFEHIMDGIDHLLFVFCLVIPVRRIRPLIGIITSFTALAIPSRST